MPKIEIDQELYEHLCRNTRVIGEDASSILRRLLNLDSGESEPEEPPTELRKPEEFSNGEHQDPPTKEIHESDPESGLVHEFLRSSGWRSCGTAVEKFLWILSWLHSHHRSKFENVTRVRGTERLYFARSREALEQHGNSVQPQKIMGSDYWVVTNNDTRKKVQIIREVMEVLGYRRENREKIAAELAQEAHYRVDLKI